MRLMSPYGVIRGEAKRNGLGFGLRLIVALGLVV